MSLFSILLMESEGRGGSVVFFEKAVDRQVLVNQWPVDAVPPGREFRKQPLMLGCRGQPRGTPLPRNPKAALAEQENQRLRGQLDAGCRDRLSCLHFLCPQSSSPILPQSSQSGQK